MIRIVMKNGENMHAKSHTELRFTHNGEMKFTDRKDVPQLVKAANIYAIYEVKEVA